MSTTASTPSSGWTRRRRRRDPAAYGVKAVAVRTGVTNPPLGPIASGPEPVMDTDAPPVWSSGSVVTDAPSTRAWKRIRLSEVALTQTLYSSTDGLSDHPIVSLEPLGWTCAVMGSGTFAAIVSEGWPGRSTWRV